MGSRSRSRSNSPAQVDQFGRVIPKKRSRSRDGDRSRSSRSRSSRRSRSRSPYRSHRHSRGQRSRSPKPVLMRNIPKSKRRVFKRDSHDRLVSVSPSSSSSRSPTPPRFPRYLPSRSPTNETNVNDPDLMKSRVFIGNLPYDKITKAEMEEIFSKYGKILGISIHERGFGFVQFEKEEDGLRAVEVENGGLLKGKRIDVKMAMTGRRSGPPKPPGAPGGRSPPPSGYDRERDRGYPPGRALPPERERSPLRGDPYDDRYRDPYRDPALPLPPVRRDDPYYDRDPYRRPPPPDDPYFDRYRDDPYRLPRRDPYADPYRDPYYRDPYPPSAYDPPPKRPLPIDCEVIILNAQLKNYAEFLERKLKGISLFSKTVVIAEDRTIPQMIEDATKRNVLFAIVVNSQNEVHQSLTLNILHGTPQEHRNMPVDDAITLINRSFDQYTKATREKAAAAIPAAPAAPSAAAPAPAVPSARSSAPFVPPSSDLLYLLNLLADSRQLTVEELDKVISYLKERREKQMAAEGRHLPSMDDGRGSFGGAGEQRKEESASLQREQQELQAKILSILNGPGDPSQAAALQKANAQRPGHPGQQHMGNGAPPQGGQTGMSSLINFDSPSVQKALDNLIQSGPNLLKTISTPQGPTMAQRAPLMSRPEHTQQPGLLSREPYGGMAGGMNSGHTPGVPSQHPPQQRPQFNQQMGMPVAAPRQAPPPPGRRPF
ncbi:nuclear receptor coactivator 5-like isoform X2 [Ylistrum balloti]|uniref:nuclear receptor coactivator 5-like isoform X2 n=1 Tax=Ylistrum balloti TaxID=509963 RepID=UPI0029058BBE|nr:nuclear receptor coactivator 5-like isoform X2 [Ylistrum balloti]